MDAKQVLELLYKCITFNEKPNRKELVSIASCIESLSGENAELKRQVAELERQAERMNIVLEMN